MQAQRHATSTAISSDDKAIRAAISQQVAALQNNDSAVAFGFAAPDLQTRFGNPERFMTMIKAHYQPVYQAQKIDFNGRARPINGNSETRLQLIHLVDTRGSSYTARYVVQKQPDGAWKIAGCQLHPSNLVDI